MSTYKRLAQSFFGADGRSSNVPMQDTPTEWISPEGIHFAYGRSNRQWRAWVYFALDLAPVAHNDAPAQLQAANQLNSVLLELGQDSKRGVGGTRQGANYREVHVLALSWEQLATVPTGTAPELADWMNEAWTVGDFGTRMTVPSRSVLLGVKLTDGSERALQDLMNAPDKRKVLREAKERFIDAFGGTVAPVEAYLPDFERVWSAASKHGLRALSRREHDQLMYWPNFGENGATINLESRDTLQISDHSELEFAAVMEFDDPMQQAPHFSWLADALSYPDGPVCVSVRAKLEPADATRDRVRRVQRKLISDLDEQNAAQDVPRREYQEALAQAEQFEEYIRALSEPILTDTSIILARRIDPTSNQTYRDWLGARHGVRTKPLEHRQLLAMAECLPCGDEMPINPFLKDVSVSMIANAGLQFFSHIGDAKGAQIAIADPDGTLVFVDPLAAPDDDSTPTMVVIGEPGSGKTYLAQSMATQFALSGLRNVFINPKGYPRGTSSLIGMVEAINARLGDGAAEVIYMSDVKQRPGMLDPFGYEQPERAALLAARHILSVLHVNDDARELTLVNGLRDGALAGARCVGEALEYVRDEMMVNLIRQQMADPHFRLGISETPMEPGAALTKKLTLIEFDEPLDLPNPNLRVDKYTREERLVVATMKLVTRAALYMLAAGTNQTGAGGAIFVDEAWTFLATNADEDLERMGRLGRSQRLMPVLLSQKPSDFTDGGLMEYVSRTMLLQMKTPDQIKAGLEMVGLEPNAARISMVQNLGHDARTGKWAEGAFKDLKGRTSIVAIGPIPKSVHPLFTTNPAERLAAAAQFSEEDGGDELVADAYLSADARKLAQVEQKLEQIDSGHGFPSIPAREGFSSDGRSAAPESGPDTREGPKGGPATTNPFKD